MQVSVWRTPAWEPVVDMPHHRGFTRGNATDRDSTFLARLEIMSFSANQAISRATVGSASRPLFFASPLAVRHKRSHWVSDELAKLG